jgi:hypothetical protein
LNEFFMILILKMLIVNKNGRFMFLGEELGSPKSPQVRKSASRKDRETGINPTI